jgi:hypothetical protein
MISDHSVPAGCEPAVTTVEGGISRARWTAEELRNLAARLESGAAGLRSIPEQRLFEAWEAALQPLLDPASEARRTLAATMSATLALSPPALDAAFEAMLSGSIGEPARQLIVRGRETEPTGGGAALAIVAGNIPALSIQVVLPALAAGRPLLVKSSSREPLFAAALTHHVGAQIPEVSNALAAVSWPGGHQDLEQGVLDHISTLVAYGRQRTLSDLRSRFEGPMVELGPRLSIAIISRDANPTACAPALAEDIALFEQRGCLSVQTLFTDTDPAALAEALTRALEELARRWPPVALAPALAAEIQQLRHQAALEGDAVSSLPIRQGTVVTAPAGGAVRLRVLPGGRTVRVQRVDDLDGLPELLRDWCGRIQGAALAGETATALEPRLRALGINRFARPGALQRPDALWANGARHLVEWLR